MTTPNQSGKLLFTSLVVLAALAGGLAGGYFLYPKVNPDKEGPPIAKPIGPDPDTIVVQGRVEPVGGILGIGGMSGERVIELLVHEGQDVKKNDELARLSSLDLRKKEKDYADIQLAEANARLEQIKKQSTASIHQAKVRLATADQQSKYDLAAQQAKIDGLQAKEQNLRKYLNRLELVKKSSADGSTIPQQQLDEQQSLLEQVQKEIVAAEAMKQKIVEAGKSNVQLAQADLDTAEAAAKRSVAEVPLESLQKNVELAQQRLDLTLVRAPEAGRILKILVRPGETITTQPILQMGNTSEMMVIAEVPENQRRLIRKGQHVDIESRSLPQHQGKLEGTVTEIGTMIAKNLVRDVDPTAAQDRRVFEVKIRLDEASSKAVAKLVNLQVDVTIHLRPEQQAQ